MLVCQGAFWISVWGFFDMSLGLFGIQFGAFWISVWCFLDISLGLFGYQFGAFGYQFGAFWISVWGFLDISLGLFGYQFGAFFGVCFVFLCVLLGAFWSVRGLVLVPFLGPILGTFFGPQKWL